MALESPLNHFAVHPARCGVVKIVFEETIQHVHVAQISQGLADRPKLEEIIGRGRGGRHQAVFHLANKLSNFVASHTLRVFKN